MPQEFQVLRCFQCSTFQVHQVKKALKWCCKLCGEKQSIIKVYGRGTGYECRQHVQKLNTLRGEVENMGEQLTVSNLQREVTLSDNVSQISHDIEQSKWQTFVHKPDTQAQSEAADNDDGGDGNNSAFTTNAVLFLAEKRARKRKRKDDTDSPRIQKSAKWEEYSLPSPQESWDDNDDSKTSSVWLHGAGSHSAAVNMSQNTSSMNRIWPLSCHSNMKSSQRDACIAVQSVGVSSSKWTTFEPSDRCPSPVECDKFSGHGSFQSGTSQNEFSVGCSALCSSGSIVSHSIRSDYCRHDGEYIPVSSLSEPASSAPSFSNVPSRFGSASNNKNIPTQLQTADYGMAGKKGSPNRDDKRCLLKVGTIFVK